MSAEILYFCRSVHLSAEICRKVHLLPISAEVCTSLQKSKASADSLEICRKTPPLMEASAKPKQQFLEASNKGDESALADGYSFCQINSTFFELVIKNVELI
jgi:hypothetical protein